MGSYFLFFKKEKESTTGESTNMSNLSNIKIAIIVAYKDFRDEEYFVPRGIFDEAGATVMVVSDEIGTAQGADGGDINVDIDLKDLDVSGFDAIVFIGGPGALNHLDNEDSYKIAKDVIAQNKILAAICVSPAILAKAGVLSGKKATVWTSPLDKSAKNILEQNGAIYLDESVVQDKNIITANGPNAAKDFANKIVDALK